MFTQFINRTVTQYTRRVMAPSFTPIRTFANPAPPKRVASTSEELFKRWEAKYAKVSEQLQVLDGRLEKLAVYKPRTEQTVQRAQERVERYSASKEKLLVAQKRALTMLTRHQNRMNRDNILESLPPREELAKMSADKRLKALTQDPQLKSGYALFSREYSLLRPNTKFAEFTQAWKELPEAEKARYVQFTSVNRGKKATIE